MNKNHRKQLRPKDAKKTLIRLFTYFKFNAVFFYAGIIFIIISSAVEVGINGLLSPIIDTLVNDYRADVFIRYLMFMAGMVAVVSAAQYLGNLFMAKLAQKTVHKIREDMFSHMEKLPVSYFDKHPHGELMSTFTNDVDMLNQSLEQSVSQIIISFVTLVGAFIMMVILSPVLTVVVVAMLIVMFFVIRFVGTKSSRNFRNQQAALGDMNGYIEEMMTGQKVVKVFNYEERTLDTFAKKNEDLRNAGTLASTYGVMLMPIMGNLSFVMYALVSMIGAYMVILKRLSVGNIASFLQFTRVISRHITQVSNQLNTLFAALAGAERIFNILDEAIEEKQGDVRLAGTVKEEELMLEGSGPQWPIRHGSLKRIHYL